MNQVLCTPDPKVSLSTFPRYGHLILVIDTHDVAETDQMVLDDSHDRIRVFNIFPLSGGESAKRMRRHVRPDTLSTISLPLPEPYRENETYDSSPSAVSL